MAIFKAFSIQCQCHLTAVKHRVFADTLPDKPSGCKKEQCKNWKDTRSHFLNWNDPFRVSRQEDRPQGGRWELAGRGPERMHRPGQGKAVFSWGGGSGDTTWKGEDPPAPTRSREWIWPFCGSRPLHSCETLELLIHSILRLTLLGEYLYQSPAL